MQTKAEHPIRYLQGRSAPAFIAAYYEFNQLKQLYRQGWLKRGLPPVLCESVAEHTLGVAVLALLLAEAYLPELDPNRVVRLALIHDFGEIAAGDLTPADDVPPDEKHRREQEGVRQVFARLPQGLRYLDLWAEYEDGSTPEARFVKEIDRLEMALQASVYEHQGGLDLQEFIDTARQAVATPALAALLDGMEAVRAGRGPDSATPGPGRA